MTLHNTLLLFLVYLFISFLKTEIVICFCFIRFHHITLSFYPKLIPLFVIYFVVELC